MSNSRSSKRAGNGINRGSLNPNITVLQSESTVTAMPSNPKHNDIVIDANTTGSIVIYVWNKDDNDWR